MSRSKRLPPTEPPASPRLSSPWPRLVLAALAYVAVTVALRLGLGTALRALFEAWNVNADTAARAPAWARALYLWQGSLIALLVSAAAIALCVRVLHARLPRPAPGPALKGWLLGTGLALGGAALFLLTDSLRLMWPLSRPRLSPGLALLWGLSLAAALSEELFTKGVCMARAPAPWGIPLAALAFFLMNGGVSGSVISGVNVALMGLVCALLYARHGLWADVAFRWGWSFATVFLLGQSGGDRAVYRLYGVSETLITGGDGGFVYGLGLTAVLTALGVWMILPGVRPSRKG